MSYRINTPWGQIIDTDLEVRTILKSETRRLSTGIDVLYDPDKGAVYVPARKMHATLDDLACSAYGIDGIPFMRVGAHEVVLSEPTLLPLKELCRPPKKTNNLYNFVRVHIYTKYILTETMMREFADNFHGEFIASRDSANKYIGIEGWITDRGYETLVADVDKYAGLTLEKVEYEKEEI